MSALLTHTHFIKHIKQFLRLDDENPERFVIFIHFHFFAYFHVLENCVNGLYNVDCMSANKEGHAQKHMP